MAAPVTLVETGGVPVTLAPGGTPLTPTEQGTPVTIAEHGFPATLIAEDGTPWEAIAFSAPSYTGGVDDDAVTLTARSAAVGATWDIEIASSGGGTPVTDTGTVEASSFTIGPLDLTGLEPGTLTATYSEDDEEIATDTATLA